MWFFSNSRALGARLMLICSILFHTVLSKQDSEILAAFGDPIQIFGDMIRNDVDFVDGLKVVVYSPTNRTFVVEMNETPLNGTFVTGTTGSNFRLARGYSYKISTNVPANDLIAEVAIPYDPQRLQNASIDVSNTYLAKLADDQKAWTVMDSQRTVQRAQFKTAMSKMTSLDGEYVIIARNTMETENIFASYGEGDQFGASFNGGPGRQDVEFMDGLRFAVQSDQPLRMNVQLKFPIAPGQIPQGMISLNAYSWVVNTTIRAEINPPPAAVPPVASNQAATLVPAASTAPRVPAAASILASIIGSSAAANSASPFVFADSGKKPHRGKRQAPVPAVGPEPIGQPGPNAPQPMPTPMSMPMPMPNAPSPPPGSPGLPQGSMLPAASPTASPAPPKPGAPSPSPTPVPPAAPPPGSPAAPPPGPPAAPPKPGAPSPSPSPSPAPVPPTVTPPAPPAAPPPATSTAGVRAALIEFPVNMAALQSRFALPGQGNQNAGAMPNINNIAFSIGRRDTGAAANTRFNPMPMPAAPGGAGNGNQGNGAAGGATQGLQIVNGRLVLQGATMLDGEYVILVPMQQGLGGAAPVKAGLTQTSDALSSSMSRCLGAMVAVVGFAVLVL